MLDKLSPEEESKIKRAFRKYDIDGNGEITRKVN